MIRLFQTAILLFLLTTTKTAYTQEDPFFSVFGFGLTGMYNYSSADLKPGFFNEPYFSKGGGMFFNFLGDKYSGNYVHKFTGEVYTGIQLEFNYNERGWQELDTNKSNIYTRKLNYVELPVLSHIVWGKRRVQLVTNIGPYVSLLFDNSYSIATTDSFYIQQYYDREPDFNFDYGFLVSPGLYYKLNNHVFSLQVRYSMGMNLIFDRFQINEILIMRKSQNKSWHALFQYSYTLQSKRSLVYRRTRPKDLNKEEQENSR